MSGMKTIGQDLGNRMAEVIRLENPPSVFLSRETYLLWQQGWEVEARLSEDGLFAFPNWATLKKRWIWRITEEWDLHSFPQLDEKEIEFIFARDWFDGPLAGTARFRGNICWYDYNNDDAEGRHFYYRLYPLTDEQIKDIDDHRNMPAGADELLHWTGPDLFNVIPIGWFFDGSNSDFYGIKVSYNK